MFVYIDVFKDIFFIYMYLFIFVYIDGYDREVFVFRLVYLLVKNDKICFGGFR